LVGIGLAIVVGIFVGFSDNIGHTFSLSRTFVFFPFFLIGFHVTKNQVMWLKNKLLKVTLAGALLAIALAVYVSPEIDIGWLLASKSYVSLGEESVGALARLFTYTTSIVAGAAVLAWIPMK